MISKFYQMAVNANRLIKRNAGKVGKIGGSAPVLTKGGLTPFVEGLAQTPSGLDYSKISRYEQYLPDSLFSKLQVYEYGSAEIVAKKVSPQEMKIAGRIAPNGITEINDRTFSGIFSTEKLKNGTKINTLDMNYFIYDSDTSHNMREICDVAYRGNMPLGTRQILYIDTLKSAKRKSFYDKDGNFVKTVYYRHDGTRKTAYYANKEESLHFDSKGLPIQHPYFNPDLERLI